MRRDGVWRGALVLGNVKILDVRRRPTSSSAGWSRRGVEGRAAVGVEGHARGTTLPAVRDDGGPWMSGAGGLGWKRRWVG